MTAAAFFLVLTGVFLFLLIYPYVIYPVILRFLPEKPFPKRVEDASVLLPSALLFCAYNEEDVLPEKLANLRAIKQLIPELEILAYSDGSDDATSDLLRGAEDILTPVISSTRKGKVRGMRQLIDMTKAEVIVFSDANVFIEPGDVLCLLGYFNDPEMGCVSATLHYRQSEGGDSATARVGGAYWRLEEKIKKLESATGSMMGSDGALFARRKAGYPSLSSHLVDDLAVSMSVIFDGLRCVSAYDVAAYEDLVVSSADEFKRKRRIACGSMSTYQHLAPEIAKLPFIERFKFHSHKTIRWWGGLQMVAAGLSLLVSAWLYGVGVPIGLLMVIGSVGLWVLGSKGVPVFGSVLEIVKALIATNIGVLEHLTGRQYATWSPAKSRQSNASNG